MTNIRVKPNVDFSMHHCCVFSYAVNLILKYKQNARWHVIFPTRFIVTYASPLVALRGLRNLDPISLVASSLRLSYILLLA